MSEREQVDLKPCPFCNGNTILVLQNVWNGYWIECDTTGCMVKPSTAAHKWLKMAARWWNKRPT